MNKLVNIFDKIGNSLSKIGEFLYKYRYWIALIIFILCIIFEISGSSIGIWTEYVNSNITDDGVLFGESRPIRSDEWNVLTPMTFSQNFDGFNYFSNLVRGTSTDVFIIYGLPVLNLVQIFRPFLIGFLFLGMAKGLSFFWCGRFIALFLVTFEFFMLLTDKKKLLSFIGAIMILLAPIIQWWFAVNGIVEIFVFGELAILLLDKYMKNNNLKKRILYLAGMIICAGGYLLVFYPAWQIPMFYVFLALAIWVIVKNRKEFKINYKDVISIIIAILILACLMIYIFYNSWDTIMTTLNTVYPGQRSEDGGGVFSKYVDYIRDVFLPTKEEGLIYNQCESAAMLGLFPLGIILSIYLIDRKNKKDLSLILMLIVYAFIGFWMMFGFPNIISKLTLMSHSTPLRAYLAIGFLDVLLLIKSMSLIEKPFKKRWSIVFAVFISCILVYLCELCNKDYLGLKHCLVLLVMCTYLICVVFGFTSKYWKFFFTVVIVAVMILSGWRVNPVRTGVDVIYDSDIIKAVQDINSEERGKWIVADMDSKISNYILMAGVPVINSTNTYPDLDKWKLIDEDSKYEDVYNRYAHITVNLYKHDEEIDNKFVLTFLDSFTINLSVDDLKTLEVKYIFTSTDLEDFNSDNINFEEVYDDYGYKIYRVNYTVEE